MWNFCQPLALNTRSKDREWSRFDLAITKLLQYIRRFVLVAVYFFDRFPLQKCMEDLFDFFISLVFCQTREPPRFELKGDGAVSLFSGKLSSRPWGLSLNAYCFSFPIRERPKMPKLVPVINYRFSNPYSFKTKSLVPSIKGPSNTSLLQKDFLIEKFWILIFAS